MAAIRMHNSIPRIIAGVVLAALSTCPLTRADTAHFRLAADLTRAIGTNPAGLPIFAGGDEVRLEVYVEVEDTEGDGYDHQGLAAASWDLTTDTGIKQPPMKPSLTYTGDVARTNHEIWLETRDGAYFVGGFGFDFYDGGGSTDDGDIYSAGLSQWLIWRADVSDDPGLQPYGLHGVGYGVPPGTDVGGTEVGNRDKWYLMGTQLQIPTTPGIYHVVLDPGVNSMIRRDRDLTQDVTNGYVVGIHSLTGDMFYFQAGAGEPPAGYPPEAALNANVTYGPPPLTIDFDGRDSTDLNGDTLEFAWDFGDGSRIATQSAVTHTYTATGYYTARLRVTDSEGLTDVAEQTIAVGVNVPPTAVAAADVHYGTAPLRVNFDGTGSTDPEDDPLIYQWDFGDGGVTFGATPSHVFEHYGTFNVKLTVTDPNGLHDDDSLTIELANQAPVAGFAMSASVGQAPMIVDFDGTESYDPDGDEISFLWDFGDGESSLGAAARHLYRSPGVYNVLLTVTDDHGHSRGAGRSLRVLLPDGRVNIPQLNNKIPSVGLSAGPTKGPAPLTVTFGLSGSDPDGDVVSVILDPGTGELISNLAPGESTTYTYTTEGNYTAEAMSFDGRGGTAKTYVGVTVLPAAASSNQPSNSSRGICGAGVAQAVVFGLATMMLLLAVRRRH